ncbi:MAG: transglutaminase domain-containing protein [Curvibacter sp.]
MTTARRHFLMNAAALAAAYTAPQVQAQPAAAARSRSFTPRPGAWRTFEVTTRVDVQQAEGQTRVWLPVPSIDSDWQRSVASHYASNGQTRMTSDARYGARLLQIEFAPGETKPWVELSSRIQTRDRAIDWAARAPAREDAAGLRFWTRPTELLPTDGIVRRTALEATRGAKTDVEKARALYEWVVRNSWREPQVRGCGEGDIKTMLETGNLGGKCADINALYVGLCRAVGLPARDVYGLRLAPSAFGYKELGGNPASLKGAQHCRAEVWLRDQGWVAADPADVAKVMRLETGEWIKDVLHPVVAPVHRGLFGGWEGNWLGWNMAHDLDLPGAQGPRLGFLMYPVCETADERLDSYSPDAFRYQITARELTV